MAIKPKPTKTGKGTKMAELEANRPTERLVVLVSPHLKEKLRVHCHEKRMTLADVTRAAVTDYLKRSA